eukprot:GCRY01003486.1.p1 GENE.GCRY01003486.1~~GCRY01003486.1.p1  ORF type:complete len:344 (+),score=83.79 GCRY01003486.1:222-1253(+)
MSSLEENTTLTPPDDSSQSCIVTIAFKGKKLKLELAPSTSVLEIKLALEPWSSIPAENQKLMGRGKMLNDSLELTALSADSNNFKFMLTGTSHEKINLIREMKPDSEVVDEFDDVMYGTKEVQIMYPELIQKRLSERVKKTEINLINPLRPNKKLLVLDLDYTLFDMKSSAPTIQQLCRPHLHQFLAAAYEQFELVIWSQTSWKWLEMKITSMGLLGRADYKIAFVVDRSAMFSVTARRSRVRGELEEYRHEVKPLEVLWRRFPQFNAKNTLHVDDLQRNFALQPKNGIKVRPFKKAAVASTTDRELLYLAKYLSLIAGEDDFTLIDHQNWRKFVKAHSPGQA